jgi:hypothetical protein
MSKKFTNPVFIFFMLLLTLIANASTSKNIGGKTNKPNFVVIFIDDLGETTNIASAYPEKAASLQKCFDEYVHKQVLYQCYQKI